MYALFIEKLVAPPADRDQPRSTPLTSWGGDPDALQALNPILSYCLNVSVAVQRSPQQLPQSAVSLSVFNILYWSRLSLLLDVDIGSYRHVFGAPWRHLEAVSGQWRNPAVISELWTVAPSGSRF